jgi:cobalamin synthase
VLGRAASVVLTQVGESASDGLGGHYVRDVTGTDAALAVVSGALLCAPLLGGWLAVVLPAAVATALLFGWWAMRKIGGLVGDVLGGAEQVAETAVLACCAAIAGGGAIAWWM